MTSTVQRYPDFLIRIVPTILILLSWYYILSGCVPFVLSIVYPQEEAASSPKGFRVVNRTFDNEHVIRVVDKMIVFVISITPVPAVLKSRFVGSWTCISQFC